jgi:hypothetical protein
MPRNAGHGIVAPRLASGKGHNKSIRVSAGYPGIHAITDTPRPLKGLLQRRDILLPQGKPWGYVSQPRFAGHSTLLSNHTFLIYIYPLYAPTPAPGCPGGRRCLAYGRGVTFCGCSSCASRRRSSSLKSISWGRSAVAWHWCVCRTRTHPCAAHRSQSR